MPTLTKPTEIDLQLNQNDPLYLGTKYDASCLERSGATTLERVSGTQIAVNDWLIEPDGTAVTRTVTQQFLSLPGYSIDSGGNIPSFTAWSRAFLDHQNSAYATLMSMGPPMDDSSPGTQFSIFNIQVNADTLNIVGAANFGGGPSVTPLLPATALGSLGATNLTADVFVWYDAVTKRMQCELNGTVFTATEPLGGLYRQSKPVLFQGLAAGGTTYTYLYTDNSHFWGGRILTSGERAAWRANRYRLLVQPPVGPAPLIGTAQVLATSTSSATLDVGSAINGNTPINYQWFASLDPAFAATDATLVGGATTQTYEYALPTADPYYALCRATDAAGRISYSNKVGFQRLAANGSLTITQSDFVAAMRTLIPEFRLADDASLAGPKAQLGRIEAKVSGLPVITAGPGDKMGLTEATASDLAARVRLEMDTDSTSLVDIYAGLQDILAGGVGSGGSGGGATVTEVTSIIDNRINAGVPVTSLPNPAPSGYGANVTIDYAAIAAAAAGAILATPQNKVATTSAGDVTVGGYATGKDPAAMLKADADFALVLADVEGAFAFTAPASYPGTGTLYLRDKANAVTLATITLGFDADRNVISRSVA